MLDKTIDNPFITIPNQPNPYESTNTERGIYATFRFFKHTNIKDSEEIFVDWIKESKTPTYIEYGVGKGNALREIRERLPNYFKVIGIDLYPSKQGDEIVISNNFSHIPLPNNYVGRGMSIAALGCYAENEKSLLTHFQELYRILTPDGKFLFSPIPDEQQLKTNIKESLFAVQIPSKGKLGKIGNNYFLCPLLKIVESAGFKFRITRKMEGHISGIEISKP